MVRFGEAPKRAALFRTETPFAKISTPVFTSPTGQRHRVEVLCSGQQIVVLGTHPGTGKPYSWHGGEPGDVARADLPELTEAVAREFVAKAAAIMRAQGWTEDVARKSNGDGATMRGDNARRIRHDLWQPRAEICAWPRCKAAPTSWPPWRRIPAATTSSMRWRSGLAPCRRAVGSTAAK